MFIKAKKKKPSKVKKVALRRSNLQEEVQPHSSLSSSVANTSIISQVNSGFVTKELIKRLQDEHDQNQPYTHLVFKELYDDNKMRRLAEEAKENMTATFKETGPNDFLL